MRYLINIKFINQIMIRVFFINISSIHSLGLKQQKQKKNITNDISI